MAKRGSGHRARRGSGSVYARGRRFAAQIDLGSATDGSRIRRQASFATRAEAQDWLDDQRSRSEELSQPVADQRLDEYLRWWLEHEAPKGKPGRAPLAATTLQGYRINVEKHLVPALGHKRVGQLTVSDLDAFANHKLLEGCAPATVNRIRETLRSALSTAVRQDRLRRNVARYGGGVGVAPPPVEAKGIIMARTGLDEDAAFVLLADASNRMRRKLHNVARDIVDRERPTQGPETSGR